MNREKLAVAPVRAPDLGVPRAPAARHAPRAAPPSHVRAVRPYFCEKPVKIEFQIDLHWGLGGLVRAQTSDVIEA